MKDTTIPLMRSLASAGCKALLLLVLAGATPLRAFEQEMDTLATNLVQRISAEDMDTVAVVDFTDVRGSRTELGRFLAEELSVALLTTQRQFQLVDRAHLSKIMEEMKLGESGIVDPETAKELGRIAGVDALVTGTLTSLEATVRLTVKVLETETANIITGDRVSLSATGPIRELLARGLANSNAASPRAGTHTRAYEMEAREAGGLRVTARAIRILEDGQVSALISISNLSSYPVRIGLPGNDREDSQCLDNNGNLFEQTRGLGDYFRCNDDYGLSLGPNESQRLTVIYRSSRVARGKQVGTIFQVSLKVKICRPQEKDHRDGKVVQFSFSDLPADSIAR